MQIRATCPGCHRVWLLDSDAADKRITCEQCGRIFKVPKPEELSKATKIIKKKYNIPKVILTSQINDKIVDEVVSSNADGYLSKSSSFNEPTAFVLCAGLTTVPAGRHW